VKHITCIVLSLFALTGLRNVAAQSTYPDKPVRMMVGASTPETVARMIAPKLTDVLGKSVVVETAPGAAGNIAAERVSKSAPDGYTLIMSGDAAMTTNVTLFRNLGYDPNRDFAPISMVVDSVNILALHPSVPAKTVKELVALARQQRGKLTYGSGGSGTSQHLGGELLNAMAGIEMVHVPYKTGAAVVPDLLSGRIDMQFGNISSLLPWVRETRLRGIAVTSLKRAPAVPDLPTIAESGYAGFEATAWVGMLAPAGTPDAIVRRLHRETERIVAQPDMRTKLVDMGFIIVASTPEAFGTQIRNEIPKKGKLVLASGAKPN
jgi:tripartite-type tricarboxylate transporter receptor subunit TctC